MALLYPSYSLILPFLFIFTIPIAIFATITTTLAFSILLFRAILIYIELAFAVIPYYLLGAKPIPPLPQPTRTNPTVPYPPAQTPQQLLQCIVRRVNHSHSRVPRRRNRALSVSGRDAGFRRSRRMATRGR